MNLALVLALATAGALPTAAADAKPTKVRLKEIAVDPADFLPGHGVSEAIGERAWKGKIGKTEWLFFDLDGSGALEPGAKDGFAIEGQPYVVRLPKVVLFAVGQCELSVEDGKLLLQPQDLGIDEDLLADASLWTELRVGSGVPPVLVDASASAHCAAHIAYMKQHGATDGIGDALEELEGKPGFTEGGKKAAENSAVSIMQDDFRDALWSSWRTSFRRTSMLNPGLERVGIGFGHGASMLYYFEFGEAVPTEPLVHPPHRATGVPTEFTEDGEQPNPVPESNLGMGTGFPVLVILPHKYWASRMETFELVDDRGRKVEGTASCPREPANPAWPTNSGAAFFIPAEPLDAKSEYTATFFLEGMKEPIVWTFETGK